MNRPDIGQIIRQQMQDLYEHHLALGDSDAVSFYPRRRSQSGTGWPLLTRL
jgi:hypothetical protein